MAIYHAVEAISSVSFKDYVCIVAATAQAYKNEPDKKQMDKSRYSDAQLKALAASLKIVAAPECKLLNLRFNHPFSEYASAVHNFDYLTTLFTSHKLHGTLPFSGSLSEQPNKIIQIFSVMNSVVNELQIQEQKKTEKKNGSR